jgi:CoA:oxalate CoA-transferase
VFQTKDADLVLNAHSDGWWPRLCRVPEFAHFGTDPRYLTRETRTRHGEELTTELQTILRTRTRDEWLSYLGTYDVLCAPVYNYAELFNDPQVLHNGIVIEQRHPTAGLIKAIGIPVKLSNTPGEIGPAAPLLGQHTREILQWLGYDETRIDHMDQNEVVSLAGV